MFTKDNRIRLLKIFFDSPNKEFYIRELARLTNLSPAGILRIASKLEKEKIILKKKNKATTDIKLDLNENTLKLKRIYNLYFLYGSGLVDFLVDSYNHPSCIILFGSYSLGEDIEKGDIDIAIITNKHKILDLSKFEKDLNKRIHLLEVDLKKVSKEFISSLINGVVVYGYLSIK